MKKDEFLNKLLTLNFNFFYNDDFISSQEEIEKYWFLKNIAKSDNELQLIFDKHKPY